jgi:hypothetical protein
MTGYVQLPMPSFNFYGDYTLSGWISGGTQGADATAFSIECVNVHDSLVSITVQKDSNLLIVYHTPPDMKGEGSPSTARPTRLASRNRFRVDNWQHIAIIKSNDHLYFYADSNFEESKPLVKPDDVPLTGVNLVISAPNIH